MPPVTQLTFVPPLADFNASRTTSPLTVLAGSNNTGKTLVLKWLKQQLGRSAYMIGTNRFYHVYHFSTGLRTSTELDDLERQFNQHFGSEQYNYDQNYIDLNRIIIGLTDAKRHQLFDLCGRLLDSSITLKKVDELNELSPSYVDIDGQNLSVASTGARLLLTILGLCMDDRFDTILIDEPELGLAPRIQRALASFFQDPVGRGQIFPHLKRIFIATHSQHFLTRTDLASNFVVSKSGATITLTAVADIGAYHRLQFNLLGNSLEGLFLPAAIIFVEGPTDREYLDRVVTYRFPGRNIVLVQTNGDPKRKIHSLKETLGDLQRNPLRSRLFVVLDRVHQKGLAAELEALGVLASNIIVWSRNGIEYVYPLSVVAPQFNTNESDAANFALADDKVALNGIALTKRDLCTAVTKALTTATVMPIELETRLLKPLAEAIT